MEKKEITYVGWFSDEPKKLDTSKYDLCSSCKGTGESKDEFPVRCFECGGDGYIPKKSNS